MDLGKLVAKAVAKVMPQKKPKPDGTEGYIYEDDKRLAYLPTKEARDKYVSKWKQEDKVPQPAKEEDVYAAALPILYEKLKGDEGFGRKVYPDNTTKGKKAYSIGYGNQILYTNDKGQLVPTEIYTYFANLPQNKGEHWSEWTVDNKQAAEAMQQVAKKKSDEALKFFGIKANQYKPEQLADILDWVYNTNATKFKKMKKNLLIGNKTEAAYELLNADAYRNAVKNKWKKSIERWERAALVILGGDENALKKIKARALKGGSK